MRTPYITGLNAEPSSFERIAGGFNSEVFRHNDTVVKLSKRARNEAGAQRAVHGNQNEYNLVREYLGDAVADTRYHVARHLRIPGKFVVVAVQPYVEGTPLADSSNAVDIGALAAMYDHALDMHDATRTIPDLACIERGLFDARRSPNVLVTPDGKPILVDPNVGKLQGSRLFGPLWNFWISEAVKRARYDM